jgi:regulator of protease activity HflC (stomatin/prohibitin superfamily)
LDLQVKTLQVSPSFKKTFCFICLPLRINLQKQAETAKKDTQEKLEAFQEEEKKRLTAEATKRITEVDNDIKLATQQMTGGGSCVSDKTFALAKRRSGN